MKRVNTRACRFLSRLVSRAYYFRGSPIYVRICWRMAQQYDTYNSIEKSLGHTVQHKGNSPFMSRQFHFIYVTTILLHYRHDNISP